MENDGKWKRGWMPAGYKIRMLKSRKAAKVYYNGKFLVEKRAHSCAKTFVMRHWRDRSDRHG